MNLNLLDNDVRVATPYIKVTFGEKDSGYTFGVYNNSTYDKDSKKYRQSQYPNYIQSLNIEKINGQVNKYELSLNYAITQDNDPNFFEKIFSSVSDSRKIVFSYGDMSAPEFLYKEEEALITDIRQSFALSSASISYKISAVSSSKLLSTIPNYFKERRGVKPSSIIYEDLLNPSNPTNILDIYTGMRDIDLVRQKGLIPTDDVITDLEAKNNISTLEYLKYLVDSMKSSTNNRDIYVFKTIDDTTGEFGGPYFKIINSTSSSDSLDTYELDIGYPSNQVVTSFSIDNDETYSLLYNYSKSVNTNEYVERINDNGEVEYIYSPLIASKNDQNLMKDIDYNWWKNVTQYPVSASITIKGLLRPAILMSKLRLKVYFYGKLHTSSGLYVINKQSDSIGVSGGYYTTLSLVRVGGDNSDRNSLI